MSAPSDLTLSVSSSSGAYPVTIEPGALAGWLRHFRDDALIADEFFEGALPLPAGTLRYPASETIKSLEAVPSLVERLRGAGANRQTRLLALGGGTIQDLTSFTASIYMRGVPWIYLPTTLLGMVDSCIGGKSAINVGPYKNLAGTFHPPERVLIDPSLVDTLPPGQQASGLVEAAKICFSRGRDCFQSYLALTPQPGMEPDRLAALIAHSLTAKKWFIETDEFDRKERLLLNFGHTFGHAIEGASHYAVPHGAAVGLGILCALSFGRAIAPPGHDPYAGTAEVRLLEEHLLTLLGSVGPLPAELARLSLDEVLERFQSDKKHRHDSYVLILVAPDGSVVLERVPRTAESLGRIRAAIQTAIKAVTAPLSAFGPKVSAA